MIKLGISAVHRLFKVQSKYALPWLLAMLVHVSMQSVYADESAMPINEDDYMGDVPTVLSVSRLLQPISDAPSAVTIINRETIRASGIVALPEIFRLVPGFYVGVNAGYVYNTNHVASYHGMTSAYAGAMQVLINGRSVYTPLYGGVQWSEIPLAITDIERIEITRGPNAASYGANAFFGVINIITQAPSDAPANTIVTNNGENLHEIFYRHSETINDLSVRATIGFRHDDGLDNRNDYKGTRFLNAQAEYQLDMANHLEFEFGVTDGRRGEGNPKIDKNFLIPRTKSIDGNYELIRWRHNISATSDFVLQGYHAFDRSDDGTNVDIISVLRESGRPDLIPRILSATQYLPILVENERYDVEAQQNFALNKSIRGVWGASVRQDTLLSPFYLASNQKDYFNLQRLFGHIEWQANEHVVMNVGAMLEHNDFTGSDVSPRASINFKITPNHTLRYGVSTALRTPSYVDDKLSRRIIIPTVAPNKPLIFLADGNLGNLQPEHILSREIGYIGKAGNVNWDVRLFDDHLSSVISGASNRNFPIPPQYDLVTPFSIRQRVNGGDAEISGYETQINWQLAKTTHVLLNYAFVRISQTKPKLTSDFIKSAPRNTISVLATHQFNQQWDASVACYQTSSVEALSDGDPVPLARHCDTRLAKKFQIKHVQGELSLVVNNVFNSHYLEFARYNVLNRRALINLTLDF